VGSAFHRSGESGLHCCRCSELGLAPLCGLGPQGGSDRVEVDKNGGPDGLEGRFSCSQVAALAPLVVELLDVAGRRRSPATSPAYRRGSIPRNKGRRMRRVAHERPSEEDRRLPDFDRCDNVALA
jgi:hypothetical protein